ncbi:MAG: lamin tail domain-containing protein [Candidatus Poseidoniaceae archaeon]|jgi:phosphatidylserine/phosphatidylglycerophosphate/cardiolipin synthase-like enzyme|nr:lamin tail domain-containing protein [Candidatus Poseidoniaceae archaeon]
MKSRALFLTSLLMLSSFIALVDIAEATSGRAMSCSGTVCLNEALPNPNGYDDDTWPNGEWMEIHNSGATAVDVLNWRLVNKASKTLEFNSTSIVGYQAGNSSTWTIQPGDYMVIARNGYANFYLTNTFDYITMEDSSGNVLDQASWNTTASGVSLEEDASSATNDWVATNSPTPGSMNSASTGPVPSDLLISEIMANPWPSADNESWPGGEWFEIWNSGQSDIDLTGWSAVDNAGNIIEFNESHLIGSSSNIGPDEYRIVAINSTTTWGVLNNGAESLRLLWPNGTQSQSISWSTTVSGFALTEQPNGAWGIAAYPTPNMPNPLPWEIIVNGTSPIRISEVLPNSTADGAPLPDGEWIELHNTGPSDIDLMGWKFVDGMGNFTQIDMATMEQNMTQPGSMISADGRRLVQFFDNTELWNNYNQIMLIDQYDSVVHKSWWTNDPGLNVSLIESQNPQEPWTPSSWPTPGQPEPGTSPVSGDIIFTEIFPDAIGNDTSTWPNGEWIELMNNGNQSVDIANWHFTSGSRNFNLNVEQLPLEQDTIIMPGEFFVVAINGSQGFYLRNTNPDTIELRNSANQIISIATYNSSTEGESIWFWNGDWSQAPWPTPGIANPNTSPYTGQHTIEITEILAHCSDDSITPVDDWIEVNNTGTQIINLSAWRIISNDADLFHLRSDRLWDRTNMEIAPNERVVFTTPNWFVSGLGGSVTLEDPDGLEVDYVTWNITTDCKTMDGNGTILPWPTPGGEEPDSTNVAGPDDLIFSRFMFDEKSNSTNDEFFEISNTGNLPAVLNGWVIRKITTGGTTFNGSFITGDIPAGASVIVSPEAGSVKAMGSTIILDADDVMDYPVWLPNSGATLQLISPDGSIADTIVYGNGPTSIEGWNGPAIGQPVTIVDRILYLRGDGCGDMQDTDSSDDWEMRWSVAGASHFCGVNTFSDDTTVTPLVGPSTGLDEVIELIDSSDDSIHLHVYQLHHPALAMALIEASNRGVDVTVVIHEPESWWGTYNVDQSMGIAWELENVGIDVLQFSSSSNSPYQYLHSKIAVIDSESVWISSGNWKESSMPNDGIGNRDWGIIVDSSDLASIVLERMVFDEDPSQLHVEDSTYPQPEFDSYSHPESYISTPTAQTITGAVSGELLTCPDDCMQGLSDLIESANSEILLSLQYFEMDWYWGWQENPLLDSLEAAAARGVSIRLVINQHYVNENPDIREAVNELNDWNGDVEAILMSENETVTKLHNKGVIIDSESVLISSINWGDNSILRNREMGLIIHSSEITTVFEESFWEDWARLDTTTDTDIDGIPDYWEVQNNLSRTDQDASIDSDNDGISNIGEFSYGSDPNSIDTDGDCIEDGNEILWAATIEGVSANDALTLADADGDGVNDSTVIGCNPVDVNDNTNDNSTNNDNITDNNTQPSDSDMDGITDDIDECPDTKTGAATDTQGCSSEQNKLQNSDNTGEEESSGGMNFMMTLVILGIIILLGAGALLLTRNKSEEIGIEMPVTPIEKDWEMPILDGTGEDNKLAGPDMSKFPGWTVEQVEKYLGAGWSEEQLADWYQQQVEGNSTQD